LSAWGRRQKTITGDEGKVLTTLPAAPSNGVFLEGRREETCGGNGPLRDKEKIYFVGDEKRAQAFGRHVRNTRVQGVKGLCGW